LDLCVLDTQLHRVGVALSLVGNVLTAIHGIRILIRLLESHKVVRAWVLFVTTIVKVGLSGSPWGELSRLCSSSSLANRCARPESKLIGIFAIGKMGSLQVVHLLVGSLLVNSSLAWQASLVAVVNKFLKAC